MPETRPLVGLIMGSKSDWDTMRHAAETLTALGIGHDARIAPPSPIGGMLDRAQEGLGGDGNRDAAEWYRHLHTDRANIEHALLANVVDQYSCLPCIAIPPLRCRVLVK